MHISIDERLLRRVDEAARGLGISRSAYLTGLAARELGMVKGPGASDRVRNAMAELDELFARWPGGEDSTAAIRAERDAR